VSDTILVPKMVSDFLMRQHIGLSPTFVIMQVGEKKDLAFTVAEEKRRIGKSRFK
jgi:hypothetical protein